MIKDLKILVIEDSKPDYMLLCRALSKIKNIKIKIINMINGQDGIDYVFKKGKFEKCSTPDIIILDINLPIKDGIEVLNTIKNDKTYKTIPIVIYTTSEDDNDIYNSYLGYANSYIIKTFDIKNLFDKIHNFIYYWAKTVKIIDRKE